MLQSKKVVALFALSALVCCSCAWAQTNYPRWEDKEGVAQNDEDTGDLAHIYILRPSAVMGSAHTWDFAIEKIKVGSLNTVQYLLIDLPPGTYRIGFDKEAPSHPCSREYRVVAGRTYGIEITWPFWGNMCAATFGKAPVVGKSNVTKILDDGKYAAGKVCVDLAASLLRLPAQR